MIYWYTGQPGHGKTLHAIEKLLEFKSQGRAVFACNVRGFDYDKTGVQRMTPEQFRDWMNFLPDGAVALVDEVYEHEMLPRRSAAAKVPQHVEQLAKHRHRGLDFIFVCQSPDKQCDVFVHDLIERHTHVRRRFGTQWVQLREFDRFERNAEKAVPITISRRKLPKNIFGTYQSTELDTTEKRIPWYFWVLGIGAPLLLGGMYYYYSTFEERWARHGAPLPVTAAAGTEADGASATTAVSAGSKPLTAEQYIASHTPVVQTMPWTAPIYAGLQVPQEPPRVFCMASGQGTDANGDRSEAGCSCVTEQGTTYVLDLTYCRAIARYGQYEPYYEEMRSDRVVATDRQQLQEIESKRHAGAGWNPAPMDANASAPVRPGSSKVEQQAPYGGFAGG